METTKTTKLWAKDAIYSLIFLLLLVASGAIQYSLRDSYWYLRNLNNDFDWFFLWNFGWRHASIDIYGWVSLILTIVPIILTAYFGIRSLQKGFLKSYRRSKFVIYLAVITGYIILLSIIGAIFI